eukprot:tig00020710_g13258.t1
MLSQQHDWSGPAAEKNQTKPAPATAPAAPGVPKLNLGAKLAAPAPEDANGVASSAERTPADSPPPDSGRQNQSQAASPSGESDVMDQLKSKTCWSRLSERAASCFPWAMNKAPEPLPQNPARQPIEEGDVDVLAELCAAGGGSRTSRADGVTSILGNFLFLGSDSDARDMAALRRTGTPRPAPPRAFSFLLYSLVLLLLELYPAPPRPAPPRPAPGLLHIGFILNCAPLDTVTDRQAYERQGYSYLALEIMDTDSFNLRAVMPQAFDFIDAAYVSESRVLVFCSRRPKREGRGPRAEGRHASPGAFLIFSGGRSRAAAIVAAYLMRVRKLTAQQALQYVLQRRPSVVPNRGFLRQLLSFQKELRIE